MKIQRKQEPGANAPLVVVSHVSTAADEGRLLLNDLNMRLSQERVAIVGRNGVGKSTLLSIVSGRTKPDRGSVVFRTEPYFVCQSLDCRPNSEDVAATLRWLKHAPCAQEVLGDELAAAGLRSMRDLGRETCLSHGELRKLKLLAGKLACPELLILDEPTQDLDEHGISWLRAWLADWPGGLLVASHESRFLRDFEHFFIVAETGCRYFSGSFAALEDELEKEHSASQTRYVRNLNRLVEMEEHTIHIARRRRRKRQYGRVRELGRATPRQRLNQKRDYAQVKHGKMKRTRDARISAIREWTKSTRRALKVDLPLVLHVPELPSVDNRHLIKLVGVSAVVKGRCLFERLDLHQQRERFALIGSNGVGKTTLLEIMLGRRTPTSGTVESDYKRIGAIAQGGADWMVDESLESYLSLHGSGGSPEDLAERLVAHKFPLALGQRPMRSLSPGERVRAALICLFQRSPVPELLVLDEPTYSLDLVGQRALTDALTAWPGGLVIASHNRAFLTAIGIDTYLELGRLRVVARRPALRAREN